MVPFLLWYSHCCCGDLYSLFAIFNANDLHSNPFCSLGNCNCPFSFHWQKQEMVSHFLWHSHDNNFHSEYHALILRSNGSGCFRIWRKCQNMFASKWPTWRPLTKWTYFKLIFIFWYWEMYSYIDSLMKDICLLTQFS